MMDWTFKTAVEQIESCDFECIAGPLANNIAWRWLKTQVKVPEGAIRVRIVEIKALVEEHFKLAPGRLTGPEQVREVSVPRQIAFKLARVHTLRSYPLIGREFSRDHTVIITGIRSIDKRMAKEPETRDHYDTLNERLVQLAASNSLSDA